MCVHPLPPNLILLLVHGGLTIPQVSSHLSAFALACLSLSRQAHQCCFSPSFFASSLFSSFKALSVSSISFSSLVCLLLHQSFALVTLKHKAPHIISKLRILPCLVARGLALQFSISGPMRSSPFFHSSY